MNIFLQCISCGARSRTDDEASAPLVRQPYLLRSQSLDRSFRHRRFRSASSVDWQPSLTAINEESSDCSSHGDRYAQQQQQQQQQQERIVVRSEKMKRSRSCGKSRVRSESFGCKCCDLFAAIFASSSAPAPFMF